MSDYPCTPKQAELALRLMVKAKKLQHTRDIPRLRAEALAMTQTQIRSVIDRLNEELGFSPLLSPASPKQREMLWDLERKLYGAPQTKVTDPLTYAEADAAIKVLISARRERGRKVIGGISVVTKQRPQSAS